MQLTDLQNTLAEYNKSLTRLQRFVRFFWEPKVIREIRKLTKTKQDSYQQVKKEALFKVLCQSSCTQTSPEWKVVSALWEKLGGESLAPVKGSLSEHFYPMESEGVVLMRGSWQRLYENRNKAISLMTVLQDFCKRGLWFWKKDGQPACYFNLDLMSDPALCLAGRDILKVNKLYQRHLDVFAQCEMAALLLRANILEKNIRALLRSCSYGKEREMVSSLQQLYKEGLLTQENIDLMLKTKIPSCFSHDDIFLSIADMLNWLKRARLLSNENISKVLACARELGVDRAHTLVSPCYLNELNQHMRKLLENGISITDIFCDVIGKEINVREKYIINLVSLKKHNIPEKYYKALFLDTFTPLNSHFGGSYFKSWLNVASILICLHKLNMLDDGNYQALMKVLASKYHNGGLHGLLSNFSLLNKLDQSTFNFAMEHYEHADRIACALGIILSDKDSLTDDLLDFIGRHPTYAADFVAARSNLKKKNLLTEENLQAIMLYPEHAKMIAQMLSRLAEDGLLTPESRQIVLDNAECLAKVCAGPGQRWDGELRQALDTLLFKSKFKNQDAFTHAIALLRATLMPQEQRANVDASAAPKVSVPVVDTALPPAAVRGLQTMSLLPASSSLAESAAGVRNNDDPLRAVI